MTTTLVKIQNLALTGIRTPNMSEHDTGAEMVLEYTDEETGGIVKIYGQKKQAQCAQWLPEEQDFYPDEPAVLLTLSSSVVHTWARHGMKYVRETLI